MNIQKVNFSYMQPYITSCNKASSVLYSYPAGDTVNFSGVFKRKSSETSAESKSEDIIVGQGMNANDMILSLKLADILHRLDDESLIVIGNPESLFFKNWIRTELTSEKSFLPHPKNIKQVYIMAQDIVNPLIIAKDNNTKGFILFGLAKNISNPSQSNKDIGYVYNNVARYGDIIENNDQIRVQFIKTPVEANKPMYDAKYPVESFFTEGSYLSGGITISPPSRRSQSVVNSNNSSENNKSVPDKTFDDIAGIDNTVKIAKKQILYPILYPEAFPEKSNCGSIFYGDPGTGKTLLAMAIIGEAKKRSGMDINFINIDGKSFDRALVGETEALWRNLFADAVNKQPSLVFIDEIDSVLEQRKEGSNYTHNNGVVSQFLTIISNIEKNKDKVWIIGATNRLDRIDPAILRNGRIGNVIEVKRPDEQGCMAILNHYLKGKNVSDEFDRDKFTQKLYLLKSTGADIAALVTKAKEKMYERCGIYDKMEAGTFNNRDLKNLQYESCDFYSALENT